jgi:hypothetical protein
MLGGLERTCDMETMQQGTVCTQFKPKVAEYPAVPNFNVLCKTFFRLPTAVQVSKKATCPLNWHVLHYNCPFQSF